MLLACSQGREGARLLGLHLGHGRERGLLGSLRLCLAYRYLDQFGEIGLEVDGVASFGLMQCLPKLVDFPVVQVDLSGKDLEWLERFHDLEPRHGVVEVDALQPEKQKAKLEAKHSLASLGQEFFELLIGQRRDLSPLLLRVDDSEWPERGDEGLQ